jgi:hypothetical protein
MNLMLLKKYNMSNTKHYLIELRNATIMWITVACVLLGWLWFCYDLFSKLGKQLEEHNQKKIQTIDNIRSEGISSDQKLVDDGLDGLRLATIKKLVPGITTTIGVGTPEEQKNLETLRRITKKDTSEKDYIVWLKNSWDAQSKENLEKVQKDIAEIIPVFSGVSGVYGTENTKHITGKITLKSLIDFIQNDIAAEYHLWHAMGAIGIEWVRFDKDGSEIGAYDIPLRFDKVSNRDAIQLLEFLARTGGIKIQKMQNNQFSIDHTYPRTDSKLSKTDDEISTLKNPLIIVNNLSISPTGKDASLLIQESQEWNIALTLTFYIRWVSGDHLMRMDQSLAKNIGDVQPGALISQANKLLSMCQNKLNCSEENKIADIINILNSARDTYKNILSADKTSSPISRVKRRSDLMTTVASIQKKLSQIEETQKNTP